VAVWFNPRMAVDYAALRDQAEQALSRVLAGDVVEWKEGGQTFRITEPDKLLAIIERLDEAASAQEGRRVMQPIREVF
jgi:hypothetical protein